MTNISQLLNTLNTLPSVELLRIRNREMTIEFFVQLFSNKQAAVSSENIHTQLADFHPLLAHLSHHTTTPTAVVADRSVLYDVKQNGLQLLRI